MFDHEDHDHNSHLDAPDGLALAPQAFLTMRRLLLLSFICACVAQSTCSDSPSPTTPEDLVRRRAAEAWPDATVAEVLGWTRQGQPSRIRVVLVRGASTPGAERYFDALFDLAGNVLVEREKIAPGEFPTGLSEMLASQFSKYGEIEKLIRFTRHRPLRSIVFDGFYSAHSGPRVIRFDSDGQVLFDEPHHEDRALFPD